MGLTSRNRQAAKTKLQTTKTNRSVGRPQGESQCGVGKTNCRLSYELEFLQSGTQTLWRKITKRIEVPVALIKLLSVTTFASMNLPIMCCGQRNAFDHWLSRAKAATTWNDGSKHIFCVWEKAQKNCWNIA